MKGLGRALDRLALELAPAWGEKRLASRARALHLEVGLASIEKSLARRRYDAAKVSPRTQGWMPANTSANAESVRDLSMLRARSRELVRNNPWANTGRRRVASNMVGDGIRATLAHESPTAREQAQGLWDDWAEDVDCDADGRTDFYGLQFLIAAEAFEAGEVLARFRQRRLGDDLVVPLQIQMLEADHLDTARDTLGGRAENGNLVRQGVELDLLGRRVAYWLWPEHPGDPHAMRTRESVRVPASSVAHCYRVERAGQLRGIPWVAPVAITAHDLSDWADASLVRSRLAAMFTGFIYQETPDDSVIDVKTPAGREVEEWEPGLLKYLKPGENVTFSNPPGVEGMDEFPRLSLRAIAVGCGIPYEVLTGDLSQVNFSSARMGWLEFQRELEAWRRDVLLVQFCRMAFEAWRVQAELAGLIPEGTTASWDPPARAMVDPKVDLEVARDLIRCGLSTPEAEARARGWRFEKLLEEQARNWKTIDGLGLSFDSDGRRPQQAPQTPAAPPKGEPPTGRPPPSAK